MASVDAAAAPNLVARPAVLTGFYLLLALITVLPLIGIDMPGLGDYPNHLARAAILTNAPHNPALQLYFDPAWHFAPYAGMDVIVVALSHVMPIYAAGRVFVALCLIMPVLAAIALRRAATGSIGVLPAFAFFVSYNYMLSRGFLTYLFGACLAVMLFALWIGTQKSRAAWRLPFFAASLIALYTCHAFAFAFYALLLGSFELWAARTAPTRARTRLAAAAATGIPAVIFALLMQKNGGLAGQMDFRFGPLSHHVNALLSAFFFPSPAADLTEVIVLPVGALMLFRHGGALRRLIAPEMGGTLLAVGLAALLMPETVLNIWGIFFRLPVMFVVLALGCLRPVTTLPPRRARLILASLAALVAIRAAGAAVLMRQANTLADQTRAVLASLPSAKRLLVAQELHADFELSTMVDHFGALATIDRAAYVPYLFLYMVQPRADAPVVGSINGAAIDLARLNTGAAAWPDGVPRPPYQYGGQEYWRGWPEHFDYVLITHFGKLTAPLPSLLRHVTGNDFADLYQVLPR